MKTLVDRYTYRVGWSAADEMHVGAVVEFPSLSWMDEDSVEAFTGIRALVAEVVEDMEASGEPVPVPFADRPFSGTLTLRLTPERHRALAMRAVENNVSLNRYLASQL